MNSSKTTSVYIKKKTKKNCKSDHGTLGPPKAYFQAYIILSHGLVGEAKEVLLLRMLGTMIEKYRFNGFI